MWCRQRTASEAPSAPYGLLVPSASLFIITTAHVLQNLQGKDSHKPSFFSIDSYRPPLYISHRPLFFVLLTTTSHQIFAGGVALQSSASCLVSGASHRLLPPVGGSCPHRCALFCLPVFPLKVSLVDATLMTVWFCHPDADRFFARVFFSPRRIMKLLLLYVVCRNSSS